MFFEKNVKLEDEYKIFKLILTICLLLPIKYCKICIAFRQKVIFYLKMERRVRVLNISDVILRLVDMVIEEKEKNFALQQKNAENQVKDEKPNEDYN